MGEMADYYRDQALCDWPEDDWAAEAELDDRYVWQSQDGRIIRVVDMTDSHVQNAFHWSKRQGRDPLWIEALDREVKRRGLTLLHIQDDWVGR